MPQQSVVRLLTVQPFQLFFALVGRIFQLFLSVVTRGRIKARRSSSTQLSRQMKAEAELNGSSGAHPAKNNIYEDFDILAEHCLSVSVPAHNTYATNGGTVNCTRAWIEGKRWEFAVTRHTQSQHTLRLWLPDLLPDSTTSSSQCSVTVEYIFWQWHRGKQVYLQKGVKCFQPANNQVQAQFSTGNSNSACPSDGYFNALIRVLEKQQPTAAMAAANKSLCPTLDDPEANVSLLVGPDSFAVSMHYLMAVSPVFQKMFSIEMLEKVHREVTLEEIGPDEFRAFLRAISPQQVHPNPYNVCELLRLADRFQVEPLRRRCEAHLVNCVEMPLIERLLCAEVYRLEQLKNYVLKSLAGSGLRDFYEENQAALNLLSKDLLIQLTSRICSR